MLGYAEKLNGNLSGCGEKDVESLRSVGLSDEEILDIVLVTGMYEMVNRVAVGLGLQPEPNMVTNRERGEARVREHLSG